MKNPSATELLSSTELIVSQKLSLLPDSIFATETANIEDGKNDKNDIRLSPAAETFTPSSWARLEETPAHLLSPTLVIVEAEDNNEVNLITWCHVTPATSWQTLMQMWRTTFIALPVDSTWILWRIWLVI